MRTLRINPDCLEFTPAYVADVKHIGIFIAVIFSGAMLLALSDFGLNWGASLACLVVCVALTLTRYDATYRIISGAVLFERTWLQRKSVKSIHLNDFISIRVELSVSRKRGRPVYFYPVLWSKENSIISRLNYSFIGSVSSDDFESIHDFIRMLKVMSALTSLPISFSKSCPAFLLDAYAEV